MPPKLSVVKFKAAEAFFSKLFNVFSTILPEQTDGTQTPSLGDPKKRP